MADPNSPQRPSIAEAARKLQEREREEFARQRHIDNDVAARAADARAPSRRRDDLQNQVQAVILALAEETAALLRDDGCQPDHYIAERAPEPPVKKGWRRRTESRAIPTVALWIVRYSILLSRRNMRYFRGDDICDVIECTEGVALNSTGALIRFAAPEVTRDTAANQYTTTRPSIALPPDGTLYACGAAPLKYIVSNTDVDLDRTAEEQECVARWHAQFAALAAEQLGRRRG